MSANGGNLELALRIKADLDQAKAQLQQLSAQIDQVGASATKASAGARTHAAATQAQADASTTATAALGAQADAQAALGETEAQATARIHDMVAASLAAADANSAVNLSEQALAEKMGQRTTATDAQIAAMRAAAASAALDRTAVAGQIADYGVLDSVMEGRVKTTEEIAAAEAALDRLQAESAISSTELTDAFAALDASTATSTKALQGNTAANLENAAAKGLNSRTTYSISALIDDAATGQFSRSKREIGALASETGVLSKLMTPLGLAIGGVVATLALLTVALVKGEKEDAKFNSAVEATNGYLGITQGQMRGMAEAMSGGATSIGQAKDALLAVADSGRFAGDQIGLVAKAAIDMSNVTGISVKQAVSDFEKLGQSPADAAAKLNEQYHFLTTSIYEQIKTLEDEGRADDAAALAQSTLAQRFADAARETEANMGTLQGVIQDVRTTASSMWDAIEGIGRTKTDPEKLGNVQDELAKLQQRGLVQYDSRAGHAGSYRLGNNFGAMSQDEQTAILQSIDLYNKLRGSVQAANDAAADKSASEKAHANAISAENDTDKQIKGYDKAADRIKAVAVETANMKAIVKGNGQLPEGVFQYGDKFSGAGFDYLVNKEAGISNKKKSAGLAIDHAQLAADVAAVQNSLKLINDAYTNSDKVLEAQHKAGQISDQAYYDGLREDSVQHELDEVAALEQEKTAAQAHIKTQADRIKADQKVAQIDTEITKVHEDAAAKREQIDAQEQGDIQKARDLWAKLRQELGTPIDAATARAQKEIADLNKVLAAGILVGDQYSQALAKIFEKQFDSIKPVNLHFLDDTGQYGSAFERLNVARDQVEERYQKQLKELQDYRNQKDHINAIADAKELQAKQQHDAALAQIQAATYEVAFAGASDAFAQLATLAGNAYGKQSGIYKTLFALSKAFAVAQAAVSLGINIAKASEVGFPYNLPFIAGAIAQGVQIISIIDGANFGGGSIGGTGGYAGGGHITGAGSSTSDSIPIFASNGEYMQRAAAVKYYGVEFMHAVNDMRLPKMAYADGGLVAPRAPAARLAFPSANPGDGNGRANVQIKNVVAIGPDQLAQEILNTPTGVKLIVHHVSENPRTIQAKWQR